jgi:heme/copper-type cytochrome/quinol oxidase subunit 2
MKKQLIYILYFIGFVGMAQETPVTISVDTTTIRIGEQIQYKISVNETNNVIFPEFKLDSLGKVEVVEALAIDTLKNRLEKKYLLTSFDSGQYIIPQQKILINNKQFLTDSLLVNVATVKVDTTKQKMHLIKSIKREPKTFDDYKHLWWWAIPILLLFALILYFIFRKKIEKIIPKVYVAPIQEAMQRLKELDEKQLLQQNKIKVYYSELTDIVRTYIEKDIKIPALESTTNELIETIIDFNESSKLGISKETIKQLEEVLKSADLVKFAKSKPIIEEIRSDRNSIEEILKNTQNAVHIANLNKADIITDSATSYEETAITNKTAKKSSFKKYIIIISIVIILVISALGYFGYRYVKNNVLGKTTSEMIEEQWYKASYGNPKITLETPEILTLQSLQLPDDSMSTIGDFKIYAYGSPISNFYIAVSTTYFISELDKMDLDAGINSALNGMEKQFNTRFKNIKKDNIKIDGIKGKKASVEYKRIHEATQVQEDYILTMLFFADTKGMRQVYVSSLWSDDSAESVVNRIIKSVSLKQ